MCLMNSSKNKLNSEIILIFNLHQTHTKYHSPNFNICKNVYCGGKIHQWALGPVRSPAITGSEDMAGRLSVQSCWAGLV